MNKFLVYPGCFIQILNVEAEILSKENIAGSLVTYHTVHHFQFKMALMKISTLHKFISFSKFGSWTIIREVHQSGKVNSLHLVNPEIASDSGQGPPTPPCSLNFDDYENAYKFKSTWELARALGVLKMCSVKFVVRHNMKMMDVGRRILGNTLFDAVMKPTFYGQFVGGDTEDTIVRTVKRLQSAGVGPLLAVPMEEDVDEADLDADIKYDGNLQKILDCVHLTTLLGDKHPMMQVKLTALLPGKLCQTLSSMFPHPSTDSDCVEAIASVFQTGNELQSLRNSEMSLSGTELEQLNKGLKRLRKICDAAMEKNVIIMVDAEYTYMNPALNLLTLGMMLYSNSKRPLVYYTYQNYLKATHTLLERDISFISASGVGFGSKLVRGAYIDKERMLAKTQGYSDPVCDTYDDTTKMYNRSMDTMLTRISRDPDKFNTIIASHNEDTVKRAVKRMEELSIPPDNGSVFFGQVYGMSDHVTVSLGQADYLIHKSIPYGTVADTLPYLSRRVSENQTILTGVRRERELIRAAFRGRFKLKLQT